MKHGMKWLPKRSLLLIYHWKNCQMRISRIYSNLLHIHYHTNQQQGGLHLKRISKWQLCLRSAYTTRIFLLYLTGLKLNHYVLQRPMRSCWAKKINVFNKLCPYTSKRQFNKGRWNNLAGLENFNLRLSVLNYQFQILRSIWLKWLQYQNHYD